MTKASLCIFLIVCQGFLLSVVISEEPYCYHFTWIAPVYDDTPDKYNCTTHKEVPCIEPVINTKILPNTTEIWNCRNMTLLRPVIPGNVCIRYTFTYNNNIVNTSLFSGKATEDKSVHITSGCYKQHVGSYVVEMCACEPRRGVAPCNSSGKMKDSIILSITLLLFIFLSFT